jgi:hypothetical protein
MINQKRSRAFYSEHGSNNSNNFPINNKTINQEILSKNKNIK